MAKVNVESDGTFLGTKISVDNQLVDFERAWFSAGRDDTRGWGTLELSVKRIDKETGLPTLETLSINKDAGSSSLLVKAVANIFKSRANKNFDNMISMMKKMMKKIMKQQQRHMDNPKTVTMKSQKQIMDMMKEMMAMMGNEM